jgi:hypothetical protein
MAQVHGAFTDLREEAALEVEVLEELPNPIGLKGGKDLVKRPSRDCRPTAVDTSLRAVGDLALAAIDAVDQWRMSGRQTFVAVGFSVISMPSDKSRSMATSAVGASRCLVPAFWTRGLIESVCMLSNHQIRGGAAIEAFPKIRDVQRATLAIALAIGGDPVARLEGSAASIAVLVFPFQISDA